MQKALVKDKSRDTIGERVTLPTPTLCVSSSRISGYLSSLILHNNIRELGHFSKTLIQN